VPAFRRVDCAQAGADALGILVPPGPRTLVILRPRGLPWDLLPARWIGRADTPPSFCTFTRDEAAGVARRLQKAMEEAALAGTDPMQLVGDARGESHQIWMRTEELVWIVCHRTPGRAYQPAVFAVADEARRHAEQLTPILWPAADAEQEYYFNTQHFS
jgi:hypothetical protein